MLGLRRPAPMLRLTAAALLVALAGCTSALGTLPLTASPGEPEALAACAGLRFDASRVLLECLDDQQVFLVRYAAPPTPETCRRLARAIAGGAALEPGPALALPAGSETFATTVRLSAGLPAAPAVVACSPVPDGGSLLALSILGDAARVLPALARDGLPPRLDGTATPDTVDLFGRGLAVDPSCRLLEPRNLQCSGDGQMSWTRFSTAERAAEARDQHTQRILDRATEVFSDERVPCRFEGVRTECRRVSARISFGTVGRLLAGGQSDRIVALSAAADVRGQHAQAECSFFDDQAAPGALATLCREAFEVDG